MLLGKNIIIIAIKIFVIGPANAITIFVFLILFSHFFYISQSICLSQMELFFKVFGFKPYVIPTIICAISCTNANIINVTYISICFVK